MIINISESVDFIPLKDKKLLEDKYNLNLAGLFMDIYLVSTTFLSHIQRLIGIFNRILY